MEKIKKYILEYLVVMLIFCIAIISFAIYDQLPDSDLTIAFLNVGQGDSIFIESPTKNRIIIDGGPNANIMTEVSKFIPWYSRWVDALLVTHPDQDHYFGFLDLLKHYQTGALFISSVKSDSQAYSKLIEKVDSIGLQTLTMERGMSIDLGGGAYLNILFPDRDIYGVDTNDGSVVSQLVYGSTTVLLMADAPKKIEKYLVLIDGLNLESDILKVGHHGSKTSTDELFLEKVNPNMAIISSGLNNRYGHPHAEVLETLNKQKVNILNTSKEGTIIFESDGKNFIRK